MHPSRAANCFLARTWAPFLYPCLDAGAWASCPRHVRRVAAQQSSRARRHGGSHTFHSTSRRHQEDAVPTGTEPARVDVSQFDHLDPNPPDYSSQLFTDACTLSVSAGAGGHGCISFLREKYVVNGPPNGGDGGTGGSVYIQAVKGETSLHKLARRGILKAGRGKNGQGSLKGGARGEDILITVPVGTVVREISRHDPMADEESLGRRDKGYGRDLEDDLDEDEHNNNNNNNGDQTRKWRRDKWLIYPGTLPKAFSSADFPALPRPRRSQLSAQQPRAPLRLDLDAAMDTPQLLAAGAMGGLGNPHFVTKSLPRPKFATKGDAGARLALHLELKLLADVGLVGAPNAGKSTLLRALTRSRSRVGSWAFTTLSPSIGTVVLDRHVGRPALAGAGAAGVRENFTIADIPGLVEDAHLDRGLGLGFLRHVERAAALAFVVDLGAGDAAAALRALWRELGEYELLRRRERQAERERVLGLSASGGGGEGSGEEGDEATVPYIPFQSAISPGIGPEPVGDGAGDSRGYDGDTLDARIARAPQHRLDALALPAISTKPWLVVATKADLPGTQENFAALQAYLRRVQDGDEAHPSGKPKAWRKQLHAVPVSAINKEGVGSLPEIILSLLDN